MGDTPDWQALTLARLTHTDPGQADTTDQGAWMLAYATLNARTGEVDPPEVLADLVQRVDSIDRSLDTMVKTNEMTFKVIGDQFRSVHKFHQKLMDSLTVKKRHPARDFAETRADT
jgi:hypothetical protein